MTGSKDAAVLSPAAAVLPLSAADMDELLLLHSEYLNYGDGIRPHFEAILAKSSTIALKAVVGGELVGILIYTEGISLSGGHEDLCRDILRCTGGECVYTGDAVLVRSRHRGCHLSELMYRAALRELRQKGARYVLHELWVYPDGRVPAKGVLRAFPESEFLGEFPAFYKDFYHYGYVCPICKEHCVCAARLYLGRIGAQQEERA